MGYNNRGYAYARQGQYDRAVADYDRALSIEPNFALALVNRGLARMFRGDGAGATADLTQAIGLQPNNSGAYWDRGLIALYSNNAGSAAGDFAKAVSLWPASGYYVLWLHIARTRAGEDDKKELSANAAKADRDRWPYPVVNLFLGTSLPAEVRAAAQSADNAEVSRNQACEADFFIGIYQAAAGARDEAKQSFHSILDACPKSLSASGAMLELKRLE